MTLLTDLPKMREMEQAAKDAPDWPCPVEEAVYVQAVLDAAQAMIEVLGCFREGDADRMAWMLSETKDNGSDIRKMIERLQRAASLMERSE